MEGATLIGVFDIYSMYTNPFSKLNGIINQRVFFYLQVKDKFGNEVTQLARPLPLEYLIIDVSIL